MRPIGRLGTEVAALVDEGRTREAEMRDWTIDEREQALVFRLAPGRPDEWASIHPKVLIGLRSGRAVNVKIPMGSSTVEQLSQIEMAIAQSKVLDDSWKDILHVLFQTDCGAHPDRASTPPARRPRPIGATSSPSGATRRAGRDEERVPRQARLPLDPTDTWVLAGRPLYDVTDAIFRYCGLPWSGGEPETFAFPFYDAVVRAPGEPAGPIDLLTCVALQPTIVPKDLSWFYEEGFALLNRWVDPLPLEADLIDADVRIIDHLCELPSLTDAVPLALLSKVAHRLRPRLVPLYEGTVGAHYRLKTGSRGESSWPRLVPEIANDLRENHQSILRTADRLGSHLGALTPSPVRLLDIVLFMEQRRFAEERRKR